MSKTRKRVLSALAILFALALVFTACLALTGCGETEDDGTTDTSTSEGTGTTTTVTGTKYTITEAGRYEVGTWVVRYDAVYDSTGAMMSLTGDVYMWVFEAGTTYFATQSDYDSWITGTNASGSTGTWTNTDGTLAFYLSSGGSDILMDMTTNADGTMTITGSSSVWGTFTVTVNPSDIIGD